MKVHTSEDMAPPADVQSLADRLQRALLPGAGLAMAWRASGNGDSGLSVLDASESAIALARQLLDAGQTIPESNGRLSTAWALSDGTRVAVVGEPAAPVPDDVRRDWPRLVRDLATAWLELRRAEARMVALQKSEQLQQALYEIGDLAGSDLDMADMLRRIHAIVGGLMYAENFYIVLYDDVRDRMRFLYFADERDPFVADPGVEFGPDDMPDSLTLALLRHGEPLQGTTDDIRQQLGIGALTQTGESAQPPAAGPESEDWLGVPMRRDDRVCGAVVVQSYDRPNLFGEEERALLSFVAQHILTALDRHRAREELERRVEERTRALQLSNRDLQAEIVERQRAERLQRALFRIAELSITAESLERFYAHVHDVVGELLYARNFYIALLSDDGSSLEFPYSIDERDMARATRKLSSGLTEYVLAQGRPLLADRARIEALEAQGLARSMGALAYCWLGVPLYREDTVVGVIAVQSYSPAIMFSVRDQELLTFVAHHISIALARKQAQDRLVSAHAELEQRVEARTRELAATNAELLQQIGERLRAEQQLTHQARHDALTGLPNRNQLLDRLAAAIANARQDPSRLFAVLFLDLDRFKLVNDSVGHSAGDELLVEAGRRIVSMVRTGDTVARLGGDEFAILIEGLEGQHVAEELARRILGALGQPCWIAGREVFPSASLGIALWHPRYRNGVELLRDADAAMYRAKAAGRDRLAVFDEDMREEAVKILDLEADLRRAINGDGFVAYYQPIVQLGDGLIVGHEALLRWRHERRGLLIPPDFIGLGEDSGLIEAVDWVMYDQVAARLAQGVKGYVSINVSPRHFRSPEFADRLLRLLATHRANPAQLRLEITEVALLDDVPRALRMLRTLRSHGVVAQLDDFGTGYSALSYLHRFPIECLKIDQSFVAGLEGDTRPESEAVIRAIQALAGTLGIHTIGEGIETPLQREILRELGCSHGQGFLFGIPAEAMVQAADGALIH
ncbi:EAL domain-containing protein [Aerolutibacter daejeonensis]|uniref:EAL domain-containing protein n=1 Tax=Aerolutibacter daejeonensis TaxID=346181 RepID=UPI001E5F8CA3|nr:EAL domain-containing protein [Lysobacter daejeonensis]